ncbi:putative radical SAM superfamily Fe-S cluster-containing enzyme [Methanomicrobium sp. W14]|uniref:tetraether lipid synthase Tes n=1 Tax=Methanomicrobium sp. W14 TaxID=2817839 RepID=UPI001AE20CDC|nr:radical SAM protein [Methanomicrobium sp. W14]MBP2132279.1 putative radical SAM superfamily Fe-S cluster-containing enzyme [Methanomicrobium sp. W14]
MVIKTTKGLCPECGALLPADIIEEDNQIWIVRTCPEHGKFKSLYWSDAEMYKRFDAYDTEGNGLENPQRCASSDECPFACGICNNHKSTTLLANIDLTNRCNLNCDFCFANARACGYVYEPSFDEVLSMLKMLRNEKPCPAPAVQFSGGEPTMRDDLVEIITAAKDLGFKQVQMATNGVKMARDKKLVKDLKEAGLSTVYLHFDGVTKETNPFINISKKAIENCAEVGQGIVLVPTVINGKNDHEVGNIIKFAADNIKVIRGVNFQPVAFTGAASEDDVIKERVTIPDLLDRIERQTDGELKKDYFYPIPCVVPVSKLVEAYTGKPQIEFTTHQHCGAATYAFVTEDGLVPVNKMIDVDEFFRVITIMSEKLDDKKTLNKYLTLAEGLKGFHSSFKKGENNSSGMFWKMLYQALVKQDFEALRDFHWNALFIGTMHFMDNYNYDVGRVQRCCIHYATPDGRLIPFCTYNSGPVFREQVWKKFSKPAGQHDPIEKVD